MARINPDSERCYLCDHERRQHGEESCNLCDCTRSKLPGLWEPNESNYNKRQKKQSEFLKLRKHLQALY